MVTHHCGNQMIGSRVGKLFEDQATIGFTTVGSINHDGHWSAYPPVDLSVSCDPSASLQAEPERWVGEEIATPWKEDNCLLNLWRSKAKVKGARKRF